MKADLKKIIWIALGGIVATTAISFWMEAHRIEEAKRALEATRRELRAQGFKTDLTDFDAKTNEHAMVRASALLGIHWSNASDNRLENFNLMPDDVSNSVRVICKENSLFNRTDPFDWSVFHASLDPRREELDAVCSIVMEGSLRFEPEVAGNDMGWDDRTLLLRTLVPVLSVRTVMKLHDGDRDEAWTNLMAATRIVTAVQPVPVELANVFRIGSAEIAFSATWQSLQSGDWPDVRLAAMQREWESANFLTNLPETAAFHRACAVQRCRQMAREPVPEDFTVSDAAKEMFHNPAQAYSDVKEVANLVSYRGREQLQDERNLLLYYRDRELELKRAIQSPTWMAMRAQPGITNGPGFLSFYQPMQEYMSDDVRNRRSMLAGAADAEAGRRIIITAIALERYRGKHGAYPVALDLLAPEFLNAVPVDFMNGQPLHYRLKEDGHFVLYSVGIDCVDDGGKLPVWRDPLGTRHLLRPLAAGTNEDIVWPLPYVPGTKPED